MASPPESLLGRLSMNHIRGSNGIPGVRSCAARYEAERIGKTILYEEITHLPAGAQIVKRDTEAVAEVAVEQPIRRFRVHGRYELEFSLVVPATTADEAERHAQRIYADNCGPFEFEHDGGNATRFTAREIAS